MPELTEDQQWKLSANGEYQKAVVVIMNLSTASLVIPLVITTKDFAAVGGLKPDIQPLLWTVLAGWVFLGIALVSGFIFHLTSAKFVKAVYKGYGTASQSRETVFEHWRDGSIWVLIPCFFVGLGFLIAFCAMYLDIF